MGTPNRLLLATTHSRTPRRITGYLLERGSEPLVHRVVDELAGPDQAVR